MQAFHSLSDLSGVLLNFSTDLMTHITQRGGLPGHKKLAIAITAGSAGFAEHPIPAAQIAGLARCLHYQSPCMLNVTTPRRGDSYQ
jgi:hypothetical protein